MGESVTVAGITVTQQTLDHAFAALRAHHWCGFPESFRPELKYFQPIPPESTKAYPEQIVYDLVTTGSAPPWLAHALAGLKPLEKRVTPRKVMEAAGFPLIVWNIDKPWHSRTPAPITEWASRLGTVGSPWLWVACDDDAQRARALAQAAVAASARTEGIVYKTARELCEEYNSADYYGENSKHAALTPYRECNVLLLDGLGLEQRGRHELRAIATVLDARNRGMLPTVLAARGNSKAWLDAMAKVDYEQATEVAKTLRSGLTGYMADAGPAECSQAMARNTVLLSVQAAMDI